MTKYEREAAKLVAAIDTITDVAAYGTEEQIPMANVTFNMKNGDVFTSVDIFCVDEIGTGALAFFDSPTARKHLAETVFPLFLEIECEDGKENEGLILSANIKL